MISFGLGMATLAGTALLLDSGNINGLGEYVSGIAQSVFGEINPVYDSLRDAFLICSAPAGIVSGLTNLVLDRAD